MKASRNRHTVTALVLWVATLSLTGTAIGQTAERYVTLDFNRAQAHVFDATTNTEVAAITVGNGPNSIVISPNGRIAFISSFFSNYVSVIDLTIAAEIKRIPVFVNQLGISADGRTVVGTDAFDDGITVIDADTLSVVRTISFNGRLGDDPNVDGDAFASSPVLAGNRVYLETAFDFGVIDLGTGTVTDFGSSPFSTFVTSVSDVSAVTADGKFVIINRGEALVIINTTANGVVWSIPVDFAFAVSASRNASSPGKIYGCMLQFVGGTTVHFSIIDLSLSSFNFGEIIGDLPLPPAFPLDLIAHIAPNSDGTRVLLTTSSVKPNVYIVDTSNPFVPALVGSPISVDTNIHDVASRITQNQPPATAPVVAAVSAPLVVNSATTPLQISGSGFASDAQVRIGHLDPQAAQFISSSLLQVSVPADAPAQDASIIVTNPNLSQGAAGADQSGILRNAFVIASGPAFQPINEVAVVNAGDATLSVLNASSAAPNPAFPAPDRIVGLAITPDGKRAYVERTFAPATIDVFNFITNSFEASIPLNASPAGQPGQTRGIVIAPRFSTGKPAAYVASSIRTGPGRFSLNLYVIDADPASATFNTVVATLPTGEPQARASSGAIAVTPDGRFAFVNGREVNGTGDLVILDLTSGVSTVVPMGTLGVSAFQPALELSPDARFLVLVADDGSAHVFDVSSPAAPVPFATIHGTPPAGFSSLRLQPRIIGSIMYTFDFLQNVVAIFNFNPAANNFSQLATFAFPAVPTTFAVVHDVTPDGKLMYLPLREQDSVAVVDTAKVLAGDPSALLTEIGAGISPHLAVVRPAPATVLATTTRYTGETTQNDHQVTNLSATLVEQGTAVPIPGQTITFTLGTQSCVGTTGASGVAACSITLNQAQGSYTVKASFAGSANDQASSDSRGFTITAVATVTG